jgi:hypothetical protein
VERQAVSMAGSRCLPPGALPPTVLRCVLAVAALACPAGSQPTSNTTQNRTTAAAVTGTPSPSSAGFQCKNCISRPVRAMFLFATDATENPAAPGKGAGCDLATTATPECFQWQNWTDGWVGATLNYILKELNPPEIVTMTRANFSDEAYATYKGSSSFTRCVHEIR